MLAVDLSFDAIHVTPQWCAARLAAGVRLAVVDLWKGNGEIVGAEHALATWREAGGATGAYFAVHDAAPLGKHFGRARANAGQEWGRLAFVAVDVEIAPVTVATVQQACDLVERDGLRAVVYTSVSKWQDLVGDSHACAGWPLWDASYGQTPGLAMAPEYGGWTARVGHQHQNTTNLDGIEVCHDLFDDAFVMGEASGPAPVPPVMDLARVSALLGTAWGVSELLDGLQSPFAAQLKDVVIGIEEEVGLRAR